MTTLEYRFRVRRRTAADWTSLNEVLLDSEFGRESDTNRMKMGDGTTAWSELPYCVSGDVDLTGLVDGNALVWDATLKKWKPGTAGGGSGDETLTWLGL